MEGCSVVVATFMSCDLCNHVLCRVCHLVNRIVVFLESGAFSSLAKLLQCPYCSDGIDFDSICKRNPSSVFSLKRDHDYYQVRQQILGFIRVLKTLENP